MILFFTAARAVFLGFTLKEFEDGHAALMRTTFEQLGFALPSGIDKSLIILGNERADMPRKRADGTINLWGLVDALFRAQVLPKYAHGMRQAWNHPVKGLPKVQVALYQRLMLAITTQDAAQAAERLGAALHTLQDTYTLGHTDREDNSDPFSPMLRLHYSPSRQHPFISPRDRVWVDAAATQLTPEAEAAVQASIAATRLWCQNWRKPAETARPLVAQYVERYTPIGKSPFQAPANF